MNNSYDNEWILFKLKDIVDIFDGPHATPTKTQSGPIFLGISNLSGGRLELSNIEHLSEKDYLKWTRRITPKEDDIVFSYETRLGEAAIIPKDITCCLGRRMGLLRGKMDKIFPKFLLYRYISPEFQNTIFSRTIHGSTVDRIPLIEMGDFPIRIPPLPTQKAIAHILGTLDDKIELNRRMNETLESIARAIFTSWFINFDPVRAKAEGRQPEGMDAATAALFPSEFETVEGQEIPKGWRISHLSEIYSIFDSKRIPLSGKERENRKGIYPYYGAASVMDFIDEYIFDGIYVLLAEDGSVINEDNSPVLQYVWGKFWVNNHAHILQGKADISTELLMQFLQSIDIHPYVTGAVQLKVSQQNLAKIPIVLPPKEICQKYSSFIQPLYVKYRYNKENSHHLSSIRDTLLPKLLSGELPIDNPEQFTGVS